MPTPSTSRARPGGGGVQTTITSKFKPTSSPSTARGGAASAAKNTTPTNKSILSFFKKVPPPEESMFVANTTTTTTTKAPPPQPPRPFFPVQPKKKTTKDEDADDAAEETRFNECAASNKRQRRDDDAGEEKEKETEKENKEAQDNADAGETRALPTVIQPTTTTTTKPAPKPAARGPFVDDSDSESDTDECTDAKPPPADTATTLFSPAAPPLDGPVLAAEHHHASFAEAFALPVQSLDDDAASSKDKDATADDFDEFADTKIEIDDGDEEEEEDDSFEGEEFRERRYMKEQARLEAEQAATEGDSSSSCPICGASLAGKTPDQATVHVNACLDGGAAVESAAAAVATTTTTTTTTDITSPISAFSKRFMRTAQPRPGQANPIGLGEPGRPQQGGGGGGAAGPAAGSAFAKLMSGHAEDAAWASAAAAASASRGKPAYERTCPFYKIMPGVFRAICVDAFRYGAVEGCRAYFLSHFHSDHYIGLTAKWCHGPIYCSRVTGSLVRNQLGTAAKWVVELDFDETVDVPGTDGVRVTLIPANHCPGSALFLFERPCPPGRQRILHCGDFRACRAHVHHALLRPSVVDALSRQTRQQRIDVCYLDTTYLNPKYSFPPQDDVVAACAGMCALLDKSVRAGVQSVWDGVLRRRAGTASDGSGNVTDYFGKKKDVSALAGAETTKAALDTTAAAAAVPGRRLLVVCGTYSIGKERICKAIAQALHSKIYATPAKIKIVAQLGDPELTALMTSNPTEAQVHMQMLMELRAETLADYLGTYRAHFSHIVGFRPSGWNYRPSMANSDVAASAAAGAGPAGAVAATAPSASLSPSMLPTTTLLHHAGWRTRFGVRDLVAQRGSNHEAMCFGAPYSEHSSFRELALFLLALRIDKVVPTVNVGSDVSRKRMKAWTDRWLAERRRGGLVDILEPGGGDDEERAGEAKLWDGRDGLGGGAYW